MIIQNSRSIIIKVYANTWWKCRWYFSGFATTWRTSCAHKWGQCMVFVFDFRIIDYTYLWQWYQLFDANYVLMVVYIQHGQKSSPFLTFHPDSKVHGANMGPSGVDRTQVGPMLALCTLLSGQAFTCRVFIVLIIFTPHSTFEGNYFSILDYIFVVTKIFCTCHDSCRKYLATSLLEWNDTERNRLHILQMQNS